MDCLVFLEFIWMRSDKNCNFKDKNIKSPFFILLKREDNKKTSQTLFYVVFIKHATNRFQHVWLYASKSLRRLDQMQLEVNINNRP